MTQLSFFFPYFGLGMTFLLCRTGTVSYSACIVENSGASKVISCFLENATDGEYLLISKQVESVGCKQGFLLNILMINGFIIFLYQSN